MCDKDLNVLVYAVNSPLDFLFAYFIMPLTCQIPHPSHQADLYALNRNSLGALEEVMLEEPIGTISEVVIAIEPDDVFGVYGFGNPGLIGLLEPLELVSRLCWNIHHPLEVVVVVPVLVEMPAGVTAVYE